VRQFARAVVKKQHLTCRVIPMGEFPGTFCDAGLSLWLCFSLSCSKKTACRQFVLAPRRLLALFALG
jgi:hypothetical protein